MNVKKIILIGLMLGAIISFCYYSYSFASRTVFGVELRRGYFDNNVDYLGLDYTFPYINSGYGAIPNTVVYDVGTFTTFLKYYNQLSIEPSLPIDVMKDNLRKKTGSAFIVYTLLGLNGATNRTPRTVSAQDWAALDTRLASLNISWNCYTQGSVQSYSQSGEYSVSTTSQITGNIDDIAFNDAIDTTSALGTCFQEKNNPDHPTVYQIARQSGNIIMPIVTTGDSTTSGGAATSTPYYIINSSMRINNDIFKKDLFQSVSPGNTIYFKHEIDVGTTSEKYDWKVAINNGLSPQTVNGTILRPSGSSPGLFWSNQTLEEYSSTVADRENYMHVLTDNDLGKDICQQAWVVDSNYEHVGNKVCAHVAYNYSLTPSVSTSSSAIVEAGSNISIKASVNNNGPTSSQDTRFILRQVITKPGEAQPQVDPTDNSCKSGEANCYSGAKVFTIEGNGSSNNTNYQFNVADDSVGTKYCYYLSVSPASSRDSGWKTSEPVCVKIGKKPKVQIWGGDLVVGKGTALNSSNVISTNTQKGGKMYGSWAEYGVFASGKISGIASGAAFFGILNNNTLCSYNRLSFANSNNIDTGCSTSQMYTGGYVNSNTIPDISKSFSSSGTLISDDSVVLNNLSSGIYSRSGDLNLEKSELTRDEKESHGKYIILKVSGTVTISDDQIYNNDNGGSKYASIADIPQLIIIAKKINIKSNVGRVDAWLSASESINTCSDEDVVAKLNINKCNKLLTVNGPVMTGRIYLRRTAGSGTGVNSGDPAEIFNLRADAYLWSFARATGSGRIQTVYTTELPPRF